MRSSVLILLVALAALLAPASAFFHVTHGPNAPRATLDTSITCQTCQAVLNEAYVISQNSTDVAALEKALDQDCQSTSSPLICDIVVAALIKELPKLPAKLYKSGMYNAAIACSALSMCAVNCCTDNTPTQIHLSTGGSPSAMTVTWVTRDGSADVNVRYGTSPSSLTATVTADAHTFTQFGWIGSIHNATMTSLPTDSTIYYQVGGPNSGWSTVRSFETISDILPANFTFLVTGDLGAEFNFSEADQQYINYAASGKNPALTIDTVIHVGDIAYADGYEERNDLLMTTLEPTASSMPYMTVPGNHEIAFNFVSYKNRFSMPYNASGATLEGMYYSWDAGCVHFVALNSESPLDTPQITADEVAWLQKDLSTFAERRAAGEKLRADMTEDEAAQCSHSAPTFLVIYMHRPMYCSSAGKEDSKRCNDEGSYLRGQVESLLVQYKADLVFSGHVHAYERMTNIVDGAVNSAGPVYILNGAGGNREGLNNNWNPQPYSVFRNGVAGLGTLSVLNSTTLSWQWYQQTDLATALAQGTAPVVNDSAYFYARS